MPEGPPVVGREAPPPAAAPGRDRPPAARPQSSSERGGRPYRRPGRATSIAREVVSHMNMTVAEVMTTRVHSVIPTAGFRTMVELIEQHRVSALPVVDAEGHVVGVVSEADLLLKEDQLQFVERQRFESRTRRLERAKSEGASARELMTAPAITISPHSTVRAAARLMREKSVKRLPVVDSAGSLVGIITRSDVLKVFLREDEQIRREIVEYVIEGLMTLDPRPLTVEVTDGAVRLAGTVRRRTDASVLPSLCRTVDGVVSVESRLEYSYDDERSRERHGVVTIP